jgi:HK97 family phage major capsid protein
VELKDLFKEHSEAVESRLQELGVNTRELKARLDEVEQKSTRQTGDDFRTPTKSWGDQVIEQSTALDEFKNRSGKGRLSLDVKTTITSTVADPFVVPGRDALLPLAHRSLRVRDLLSVVQVSSGSIEYPRQTAYTNAAASVAEGALKAESAMTFDLVTAPIRTIAHWLPASRQILDDAPQLKAFIDSELMYGLAYVEDNQLLNGGGTGTDLNGIYTQATTFTANPGVVASPTKIDVILYALLQNAIANIPADGIVLHHSDWVSMLATKDSAGNYVLGDPGAMTTPNLFGIPVAQSLAMSATNFLVGDFKGSATLYDRWAPRVEISTEHDDYFTRNLVAVLCEERIGLGVKRPTGFTKGSFATVITDLTS